MARQVVITKALTAASANNIALSQTTAGAAKLTLNGSTAGTLDTPRRILITSAGNDLGITFTVTGYPNSQLNTPITQTIAGTNGGTSVTTLDFYQVTSIKTSGATSGSGVTVGTNTTGSTQWVSVSPHTPTVELTVQCEVTGTVTYSVEYTTYDLNYSPTSLYAYNLDNVIPATFTDALVNGLTTSAVANLNDPIAGARITITSGTGSVKATFLQAGIAGPH